MAGRIEPMTDRAHPSRPPSLRAPIGLVAWGTGLAVALGFALLPFGVGRAQTLIADLSDHLIAITTVFTGSNVVLFGTTGGKGEVVVVVTGPRSPVTVRRKSPVAGIWVNRKSITFDQVPSYYYIAASAPLSEVAPPAVMARHGIGVDHIRFEPDREIPAEWRREFRDALIRNKRKQGLYPEGVGEVRFLGDRLFRTSIEFPANVPTGFYTVEVFLIDDGEVIGAQTTPLSVSKTGFSAEVAEFAYGQPALYGICAVILAVSAGWLAGVAFRRA